MIRQLNGFGHKLGRHLDCDLPVDLGGVQMHGSPLMVEDSLPGGATGIQEKVPVELIIPLPGAAEFIGPMRRGNGLPKTYWRSFAVCQRRRF